MRLYGLFTYQLVEDFVFYISLLYFQSLSFFLVVFSSL